MYINTTTHAPISENDIRALYPNTSFPSPFTPPDGYLYLFPAPQPAYNPVTQTVREVAPELTGMGHWEQRWEVAELYPVQVDKDAAIAAHLVAVRLAKWEAIKAKRDALSDEGGYKVVVNGVDKWFHSDSSSKIQQLSLVVMGAAVSNVPPWKTMDGTKVTLTQTLVGQIFQAAVTQDGTLFAVAENHRTAMAASANPATYDFSGGWPATYLGA